MVRKQAWGRWAFILPIGLGLVLTEVPAAVEVGLGNRALAVKVSALVRAGYVAVPNANVLPSLEALGPAVWGGLFFTLTLGAGLSLLSLAAAWMWQRVLDGRRPWLILFGLAWLALVTAIYLSAGRFWITACYLIAPPAVFLAASWTLSGPWTSRGRIEWLALFLPICALMSRTTAC